MKMRKPLWFGRRRQEAPPTVQNVLPEVNEPATDVARTIELRNGDTLNFTISYTLDEEPYSYCFEETEQEKERQ